MAWSPLPTHQHLIAAGLSSGRTLLLSLSPSTLSPTLPITDSLPVLNVRHSRAVTALAFSDLDPNYLASGLERHRSDFSLLIWDLSTAISSIPPDSGRGSTWERPLDRLEPTHALGRDTGEIQNIQHYCPQEHIHSVAFIPKTTHNLLASANNKTIRLYDLRVPGPSKDPGSGNSGAVAHWTTRAVNGLTPDAREEGRFSSWESGPNGSVVRIWDTRKPKNEVLSFDVSGGGVVGLDWMVGGMLGIGTKEGVSVWEVVHGRKNEEEWTTLGEMRNSRSFGVFPSLVDWTITTLVVVKPKQQMQSFALNRSGGEVLYVVKDGTIAIGPMISAAVVCVPSQKESGT